MSAKDEAIALKLEGNKAFSNHDWPTAVDFYTKAIEKYNKDPSFFCNRSQVSLGIMKISNHN
jgi:serine/threonine-protein phosphatase 5